MEVTLKARPASDLIASRIAAGKTARRYVIKFSDRVGYDPDKVISARCVMVQNDLRLEKTIGDAAVSGLFSGLLAGAAMGAYLVLTGMLAGESLSAALIKFTPGQDGSALQGFLLHLAVSGIYGIGFGLARFRLPGRIPGWLAGLAYGLVLLALAELVILPGASLGLVEIPKLHLGAAHLLYGLILGLLSH